MAELDLLPVLGMNNVSRDDALSRGENGRFVRDALNVDIHADGRVSLRHGLAKWLDAKLSDVWQSPLHKDVFAVHDAHLVLVDRFSGSLKTLLDDVHWARFVLLNNKVAFCCNRGWFVYGGAAVLPLGVDTPPTPAVTVKVKAGGSLAAGTYGVAVSWLRGGLESGLGTASFVDVGGNGALGIALPFCWDKTITAARVYLTDCNGGTFRKAGDYAPDAVFDVFRLPELGRDAENQNVDALPAGEHIALWRGRLWAAHKNVLRFSRALSFHWHDARHDYIQFPQRISFVAAVENGLWVGQQSGVVFLQGDNADGFSLVQTGAAAPVAGSACVLPADLAGEAGGGLPCALWLAENGFVLGTAGGQIVERHSGVIRGITGSGASAVFGREVVGLVA